MPRQCERRVPRPKVRGAPRGRRRARTGGRAASTETRGRSLPTPRSSATRTGGRNGGSGRRGAALAAAIGPTARVPSGSATADRRPERVIGPHGRRVRNVANARRGSHVRSVAPGRRGGRVSVGRGSGTGSLAAGAVPNGSASGPPASGPSGSPRTSPAGSRGESPRGARPGGRARNEATVRSGALVSGPRGSATRSAAGDGPSGRRETHVENGLVTGRTGSHGTRASVVRSGSLEATSRVLASDRVGRRAGTSLLAADAPSGKRGTLVEIGAAIGLAASPVGSRGARGTVIPSGNPEATSRAPAIDQVGRRAETGLRVVRAPSGGHVTSARAGGMNGGVRGRTGSATGNPRGSLAGSPVVALGSTRRRPSGRAVVATPGRLAHEGHESADVSGASLQERRAVLP
jgi:hypothetical protein